MSSRQSQHRTPRTRYPDRVTPRAAGTPDHYARLAHRITPRDLWLLRMLYEHKVLTSTQIVNLAWNTKRAANYRLRDLYLWRVVDRFQPHIPLGDAPAHYTLGPAGATILAASAGLTVKDIGYNHTHEAARAHSLHLAHTTTVNDIFTTLIWHTRTNPDTGALTAWWGETRCQRTWGEHVRPDAYARWCAPGGANVEFFLEQDLSTEPLTRVTRKLHGYSSLAESTGIVTPILFWFETTTREANARAAFREYLDGSSTTTPIATTATNLAATQNRSALATDVRWLPLTDSQTPGRFDLDGLAQQWPIPAGEPTARTGFSSFDQAPPPVPPGRNT